MIAIRPATPTDVPALADLLWELFSQEHEFVADRTLQVRGLTMLLGLPDSVRILVADDGVRPLGMGVLHYSVSTALGCKVATVEDVIVTHAARGRGTGHRLMAALVEQARRDGAQRITLLTDHDNVAAHRFYESFGFTRSTMVPYRLALARQLTG